jgi:putative phosphoribosyl transferase
MARRTRSTLQAMSLGPQQLPAAWQQPARARGWVVLLNGAGGKAQQLHNRFIAQVLREHELATLLLQLLRDDETHAAAAPPPDAATIGLLAQRLTHTLDWLRAQPDGNADVPLGMAARRVGLFAAGIDVAAALLTAAERPARVAAVVSYCGRGALSLAQMAQVQAPTLLISAGADEPSLTLNRQALRALHCEKRLEVVPGATPHLHEPGALDAVAHLAATWFVNHCVEAGAR